MCTPHPALRQEPGRPQRDKPAAQHPFARSDELGFWCFWFGLVFFPPLLLSSGWGRAAGRAAVPSPQQARPRGPGRGRKAAARPLLLTPSPRDSRRPRAPGAPQGCACAPPHAPPPAHSQRPLPEGWRAGQGRSGDAAPAFLPLLPVTPPGRGGAGRGEPRRAVAGVPGR